VRGINRLLGLAVGLGVAFAGGLLGVEVALGLANRRSALVPRGRWAETLSQLQWADPGLQVTAAVLVLLGLVLLAAQLIPRRPDALAVRDEQTNRRTAFARSGLQRRLHGVALADEDVLSASVKVRSRGAKAHVRVPVDADVRAVRTRVRRNLRAAVAGLSLRRRFRCRVDVRKVRDRTR
jgi:hypothetical protein